MASAKRKAPMSIQPHVLMGREGMLPLVALHLSGKDSKGRPIFPGARTKAFGAPDLERGKVEIWQVRYPDGRLSGQRQVIRGKGMHYDLRDGLLYIELLTPLFDSALKKVTEPASLAVKRFKRKTQEKFPLEKLDLPRRFALRGRLDGLVMSRTAVLALTSKMGCYSMNQPAGPQRKWGGSCPASAFGFAMLKESERVEERVAARIKKKIDPELSICNGCYALKGAYGNPSQQFTVETRRQFFEVMLRLDPKGLSRILSLAIRVSQQKSIKVRNAIMTRKRVKQLADIPHPAFFRIHDAGDCYSSGLFKVWIDVAKSMPDTTFWMPTRMWLIPSVLGKHLKQLPRNFILRPSAFHFGDPTPKVSGYSAGSTAAFLTKEMSEADMKTAASAVGELVRVPGGKKLGGKGFICPAYMPPEWGGGLREKMVKGKRKLAGGGCTRAQGIGADQAPEPKGMGCRVCWLNPDVRVLYPEH